MKDLTQEDKLLHLLLEGLGQLLQVVARHQSIAMGKEDAFAVDGDGCWLAVDLYACLLGEPTESPDVVVAYEEMDLYSFVSQRFERVEDGAILLLAAVAPEILAPEVEYISEQVDGSSILRHVVEHGDDGLLVSLRIGYGSRTQMRVGEEVCHV